MKGEKGVCSAPEGNGKFYLRTKFISENLCKEAKDFFVSIKVVDEKEEVYHCRICKMWHFGNKEQILKFKI
jgi:hypothetical protein